MTGHPQPGDPATQEWHTAMTRSTGARLREALEANQQLAAELQKAQAALAASQADLTRSQASQVELLSILDAFQVASGADRNACLQDGIDAVKRLHEELADTRHQWALDIDALIDARQENEQLSIRFGDLLDESSWIVARDGGRHCERCEGEVRRGEAYQVQDGAGGLVAHVLCPDIEVTHHA